MCGLQASACMALMLVEKTSILRSILPFQLLECIAHVAVMTKTSLVLTKVLHTQTFLVTILRKSIRGVSLDRNIENSHFLR